MKHLHLVDLLLVPLAVLHALLQRLDRWLSPASVAPPVAIPTPITAPVPVVLEPPPATPRPRARKRRAAPIKTPSKAHQDPTAP